MTAVEWLYIELWKQTDFSLPSNLLEQAKEMEKQQIIDSYHINPLETKYGNIGEQYYNETFKNTEK